MIQRPIRILILDDEIDSFLADFEPSANINNVIIDSYFTNATDGIKYLKANKRKIDAIILDGFFKFDKDSSVKKDIRALKETVEELKKILISEKIRIPFCVLTGYLDDISKDSIAYDVQIFEKGSNNSELFKYLKNEVEQNEIYQIRGEFKDVFDLFASNLMPEDKEDDMIEILLKLKSKARFNSDDAFNPIRKMYEAFINCLYEVSYGKNKNQDIVPDLLFSENGKLNITGSYHYLSGNDVTQGGQTLMKARNEAVWPDHISQLANLMIQISHKNSHDYPEDVHHYAYKSSVFALLEILLWYKNFIKNYH